MGSVLLCLTHYSFTEARSLENVELVLSTKFKK